MNNPFTSLLEGVAAALARGAVRGALDSLRAETRVYLEEPTDEQVRRTAAAVDAVLRVFPRRGADGAEPVGGAPAGEGDVRDLRGSPQQWEHG